VKARAYGEVPGGDSARAALTTALSTLLRLFAPFLPYVTEEVWSWWQEGSVHRAPWPTLTDSSDISPLSVATAVLAAVRKAKSAAQQSMRAEVALLTVAGPALVLSQVQADLTAAGNVREWAVTDAPELSVTVTL
jgi:valyl-tRNA synthetase